MIRIIRTWSGAVAFLLLMASGFARLGLPEQKTVQAGLLITSIVLFLLFAVLNFRAIVAFFTARSVLYGFNTGVVILIVLAIFIVLEIIWEHTDTRFDFSAARRNTLTNETRKILSELDQEIVITGYFQKASSAAREMRLLLDLYEAESDKVTYVFIDPYRQPELLGDIDAAVLGQIDGSIHVRTEKHGDWVQDPGRPGSRHHDSHLASNEKKGAQSLFHTGTWREECRRVGTLQLRPDK